MALFSKSAAKLLQQTAKTCQYLNKNAKKVHFFQGMVRYFNLFRKAVNFFRNGVNLFRKQYSNTSYNWRSCLPCTALPFSHTAAYPRGVRHSMYCAQSSKWGLFGRNTRSAIQGTSSRSSVGKIREGIREGKETAILIIVIV